MARIAHALRPVLAALAALASLVASEAAENLKPMTYADILEQLTDLDRLAVLQNGMKGGLFSSWDRGSRTNWGANGDAGQYLRIEPNGEAVMVDMDGPGVIYRTWSANPMGKLRIYLDGAAAPTYEWNFPDLFDGKLAPFINPLVYRRDNAQSASDCYVPIPFAKHIKITADKAHGEYYHFNYVLLPKDRVPTSFRLPLNSEEEAALKRVAKIWSNPGRDPKPEWAGQKKISKTIKLDPGQTAEICAIHETGVIRAIRARVRSDQRYAWRKLVLRGTWDGATWPQILTPLGPFFGFDWETAEYGSVPAGCHNGEAYQYFPMPFRKSAMLSLQSFLEQPATVDLEIEWAPRTELPRDSVYFYARWRHEPDLERFDYAFLETAGHGHFVGVSMPIDHPLDGWWGEGDEMVWVDDDDFPPYIGTGSEDYFGDAWGIRYLSGPSYGAASLQGHRTCNYRWHFADLIPFSKRMRITIENYGPNGQGPRGQYAYSSTAFWYQAEATPPFAALRGAMFTGGMDPVGPPKRMEYDPNIFVEPSARSLRTYGLELTFAQQAETLLADVIRNGKAKLITDALRSYEFDREQAVAFGSVAAGQSLCNFKLKVDADGVYYPRLHTAPEAGVAELSLAVEGKSLPVAAKPSPQELQLQGIFLKKGEHPVVLVAVTAGEGIFDCLRLQPATRVPEAIEAEELSLVRSTGEAPLPVPGQPAEGVSAGRVLEFQADKSGQGFVFNLGKRPHLPYVLGIRPMLTPQSAIVQAFVKDQPIGPQFDLYRPEVQRGPSVLPLGSVPSGAGEVELRVVGRNEHSQGWNVALDYLRWEPSLMGPGTAEGIWAQVIGVHDCDYRGQDLGGDYSDGHQLWIIPCNLKSWIDIGIEVPRGGGYEISVKFTKSWDYARIQTYLDGKPLGVEMDTYAPSVVPGQRLSLGRSELIPGRHVLRFEAVGHNAESKGYLMGIDDITVK